MSNKQKKKTEEESLEWELVEFGFTDEEEDLEESEELEDLKESEKEKEMEKKEEEKEID